MAARGLAGRRSVTPDTFSGEESFQFFFPRQSPLAFSGGFEETETTLIGSGPVICGDSYPYSSEDVDLGSCLVLF